MSMKKLFILVPMAAVFLSGCSLPTVEKSKQSPAATEVPGGFSAKIERGSLWKTSDSGQTFEVKSQVDETTRIEKADILSIAYHPKKPATIYVSTVDNGILKTEDGGDRWEQIPFPPKRIYSFILDRNDPDNRMFASGVLGEWSKIFRTEDGGGNWTEVYTEPGQKTFISALSQHFRDMNVIFAGTSAGTVVKSTDGGNTWKNIGNKLDGAVADIAFDAQKPLVTYLLMLGKKLYYSPDSGKNWLDWEEEKKKEVETLQDRASELSKDDKQSRADAVRKQAQDLSKRNQENRMPQGIISIAVDPTRSGTIYAGTNKGLYRSTDYGKYWYELNIIESAKKFPIRSIAVDPKNSQEIVFVAGKAFYRSVNGGDTWSVTGLNVDRDASFVSYDPFDSKYLFLGLRSFK